MTLKKLVPGIVLALPLIASAFTQAGDTDAKPDPRLRTADRSEDPTGNGLGQCAADVAPRGGDGFVDINDLMAIVQAWGTRDQSLDIVNSKDHMIDIDDFFAVANSWGACP